MKTGLSLVAMLTFLHAAPLVLAAEIPTPPEKASPPRTPQTGVDPGIKVDPGPSPDPRAAVPPKSNPDPNMAINPDVAPMGPPEAGSSEPRKKLDTDKQPGEKKMSQSSTSSLRGQVLKIETDSLILSTQGGGQARLKLDANTKVERALQVGDILEVELSPEREIVSVRIAP